MGRDPAIAETEGAVSGDPSGNATLAEALGQDPSTTSPKSSPTAASNGDAASADGAPVKKRKSVANGAMWSAVDFWTQQISSLLTLIVVGNIVGPAAVGVLTMAQLAVSLAMTFIIDGLSDALIQRNKLERRHFDTVFWLLLGMGGLAGLILAALSPAVAFLFGETELVTVLALLSLGLPFVGINSTYQAMLQRDLRFRLLAVRSLFASGIGFSVAVVMASSGYGVLSLVGFFVVSRILEAFFLLAVSGLRLPAPGIDRAALKDIVSFGKHRMGHQLVGFIALQIDRFSVALFLGPLATGLYSVAERLTGALTYGISGIVTRVAFPVLSARQNDQAAFDRAIRSFLLVVNVVAMPVFVGLAVTSNEVIGLLFTEHWSSAAPILAILSIAAIPLATGFLFTAAINARGRPDVAVRYSLIQMILRLGASLIASQYGLEAVALANLVMTALSVPIAIPMTRTYIPSGWSGVLYGVRTPLIAAGGMAAATLLVGQALVGHPLLLVLIAKILTGVLSYSLAVYVIAPELVLRELPRLFASKAASRPGAD